MLSGSLHVSAYEEDEGSLLISHLGISTSEAGWKRCPFCPTKGKARGKHLLFSGTTGVSFMAEMQQEGGIQLDDPVKVELSAKDTYPAVFQFTPAEDISGTQLDVTVTSESDDVPAYLKVSRDCKDVKENIDDVDYKGGSLRLSFAKKGRITLSKFSTPPLTASTSSWFIGIAIKNTSGDTPIDARKTVTLTLKRSFDYTYTDPFLILFLGCGLVGIFISFVAWLIFRECTLCCWNQGSITKITCPEFFSAMLVVLCRHSISRGRKTYSYITLIVGWVFMVGSFQFVFADWYVMIQEGNRDHCYYNDFCYRVRYADIPYNLILSNLAFVLHGLILAANVLCMESEVFARCLKIAKERTSENAETGQNENENKNESNETGQNEDESKNKNESDEITEEGQNENENKNKNESKINYKKLPDHALWCPDISLHLGDRLVPPDDIKPTDGLQTLSAEAMMNKFSFSIPYAFAWALCFEGMYSALYHLCPSKLAFQFDTAFMFVMASLSVILMYNGIETTPCTKAVHAKRRVGAANFFLFFLVPLFVLNYFGTMYHSEAGLTKVIPFSICLCLWMLIMAVWVLYKLCPKECTDRCICFKSILLIASNERAYQTWPLEDSNNNIISKCPRPNYVFFGFCSIGFLAAIGLIVLALVGWFGFAEAFLYLCLGESALVAVGVFLVSSWLENSPKWWRKFAIKILFGIAIVVVIVVAVYFFREKATTDKSKSPEKSRDLNRECFSSDFFDDHDIWHILSSSGLFMGALMMIHVSYESPNDSSGTPPQPSPGPSDTRHGATEPV